MDLVRVLEEERGETTNVVPRERRHHDLSLHDSQGESRQGLVRYFNLTREGLLPASCARRLAQRNESQSQIVQRAQAKELNAPSEVKIPCPRISSSLLRTRSGLG
jgi:hypothetical protein